MENLGTIHGSYRINWVVVSNIYMFYPWALFGEDEPILMVAYFSTRLKPPTSKLVNNHGDRKSPNWGYSPFKGLFYGL